MRLSERNQHDSEITNEWRRARAKEALAVWMKECGTSGDDQTDIQDMITDLLHLARVVGSNLARLIAGFTLWGLGST